VDISPPGPEPPFSFLRLIRVWKERHSQPEHQHQSDLNFYLWRVLSIIISIFLYLPFQVGTPLLVIFVDRQFPAMPSWAIGFSMLAFIALGFVMGYIAVKGGDRLLTRVETRGWDSDSSTSV